jgi:hypothetical protein
MIGTNYASVGLVLLPAHLAAAAYSCENLTSFSNLLEVDSLTISSASIVAANSTTGVPSYCDVVGSIGGRIGVWFKLPDADVWNGRYSQYGCGGACGYNPFTSGTDPGPPITAGYALGTNNMGNNASDFSIFNSDFQARIDWSYLATHLNAVAGKSLVKAYYGCDAAYSYHIGGSTGGRQGLVEAQRYPGDFDGISATAPAYDETSITLQSIAWNGQAVVQNDSSYTQILTAEGAELVRKFALTSCDGLDGLVDGIITDPRGCTVKLDGLLCSPTATNLSACLTAEAVEAAKKLYSGPVNSTGASLLLEGLLPGSEFSWASAYIGTTSTTAGSFTSFAGDYASNYAFWPSPTDAISPLDISMDLPESKTIYMLNGQYGGNADLRLFRSLGSKLLIFQGLADPAVAPSFALDYYNRVVHTVGDDFLLLYEMPGVGHVAGGPGADTFNGLGAVAAWVEDGIKPYDITASHLNDDESVAFTRPLFPYPELAFYNGFGDINVSTSWVPKQSTTGFWSL